MGYLKLTFWKATSPRTTARVRPAAPPGSISDLRSSMVKREAAESLPLLVSGPSALVFDTPIAVMASAKKTCARKLRRELTNSVMALRRRRRPTAWFSGVAHPENLREGGLPVLNEASAGVEDEGVGAVEHQGGEAEP